MVGSGRSEIAVNIMSLSHTFHIYICIIANVCLWLHRNVLRRNGAAPNCRKLGLLSREQQVRCNGKLFNFLSVQHGVLQGSILGQLLFLIYINDMPNATPLLHIPEMSPLTQIETIPIPQTKSVKFLGVIV